MMDVVAGWIAALGPRILILIAVALGTAVVSSLALRVARKALDSAGVPSASIFILMLRALVWSVAFILILKPVFGQDPVVLVGALGVGSVALSLGMQDTMSNLVSGLSLMLGRVVRPGDRVSVGTVVGEVTDVTWRSTTVRSRNGSLAVIPNSVLNKTTLAHITRAQEGMAEVPLILVPGADPEEASREALALVQDALGDMLDPVLGANFHMVGYGPQGPQAMLRLHVADGVPLARAADVAARSLHGTEWLLGA